MPKNFKLSISCQTKIGDLSKDSIYFFIIIFSKFIYYIKLKLSLRLLWFKRIFGKFRDIQNWNSSFVPLRKIFAEIKYAYIQYYAIQD